MTVYTLLVCPQCKAQQDGIYTTAHAKGCPNTGKPWTRVAIEVVPREEEQ